MIQINFSVIHEVDVKEPTAFHALIQFGKEESPDQGAERTAQRYPALIIEELMRPVRSAVRRDCAANALATPDSRRRYGLAIARWLPAIDFF